MTQFKISKESAQAILNYLQDRPYRDVFQLINLLARLEPIPEKEETKDEVEPSEEQST